MALDTHVFGDPAACRALGEWMKRKSADVHEGGSVLYRVRSDPEALWKGPAGEAFREHVGRGGRDADDISESVESAGGAVVDFADDLDTVRVRMAQAREVAAAAGLAVTATGIEEPGPAPTAPQNTSSSIQVIVDHANAVAAHERKVAVWNEVQTTVAQAREIERRAHAVR